MNFYPFQKCLTFQKYSERINKVINMQDNEYVPIYRMKRHLPEEYDRRSIVETVHSVIKRKSESFVRSRIPKKL